MRERATAGGASAGRPAPPYTKTGFCANTPRRSAAGRSLVGNLYVGRVCNLLPGMNAAFVDIGQEKNAFLQAGDVARELQGEQGAGGTAGQKRHPGDGPAGKRNSGAGGKGTGGNQGTPGYRQPHAAGEIRGAFAHPALHRRFPEDYGRGSPRRIAGGWQGA